MLVEAADQSAHLIVPELNIAIMEACREERLAWVEGDPFNSVALGFKLREHLHDDGSCLLLRSPGAGYALRARIDLVRSRVRRQPDEQKR